MIFKKFPSSLASLALSIGFFLIWPLPSYCLDLKQAQESAMTANLDLREQETRVGATQIESDKAISTFLPHIRLTGRHLFQEQFELLDLGSGAAHSTMPAVQPYTILSTELNWNLFDGLASTHNFRAAAAEKSSATAAAVFAKLKVRSQVRTLFYQAFAAKTLLLVSEQHLQTLDRSRKDIQYRVASGVATKYDLLKIESQIEDAKSEKRNSEDNIVIAKMQLLSFLGESVDPSRTGFELEGSLPENFSAIENKLNSLSPTPTGFKNRQDRNSLVAKLESAKERTLASKNHWSPKIGAQASYEWYNNQNHAYAGEDAKYRNAYMLGVNFSWTLYDGGQDSSNIRLAILQEEQSRIKLQALDQRASVDYEMWLRKLRYSISSYKAQTLNLARATESVRLAESSFHSGTRTFSEVLDALSDEYNSRAKVIQAQLAAIDALGHLELTLGETLDF